MVRLLTTRMLARPNVRSLRFISHLQISSAVIIRYHNHSVCGIWFVLASRASIYKICRIMSKIIAIVLGCRCYTFKLKWFSNSTQNNFILGANGKGFTNEYVGIDLNTLYTHGVYCVTNGGNYGGDNSPIGITFTATIVVSADSAGRIQQLLFNVNDYTLWVRNSGREHTNWGSWGNWALSIPQFYKDYTTLAALAGAVLWSCGSLGFKSLTVKSNIDNLDGGLYNGIGWSLGSNNVAGYLLSLKISSDYRFQVALIYSSNSNEIYHRSYNVSYGWSEWKKVTSV